MRNIEDAEITMRFVKSGEIYGYDVPSLKYYDWEGQKEIGV